MTPKSEQAAYKLNLTGAGVSIQRSVSEAIARSIIALVMGGPSDAEGAGSDPGARGGGQRSDASSPKAFMSSKRPQTDMERVTCLAYYLTHNKNTASFKTKELTDLNTDAAQPKLSNPSATARNAVANGYLSLAGGARKQITSRGEALVNALPDRDKLTAAMVEHPLRKPRKRRKSRGAK